MSTNFLDLFIETIKTWNVNIQLLKKDNSNLSSIDHHFHANLYKDFDYKKIGTILKKLLKPGVILEKTDSFNFSYLFLQIPEEYLPQNDCYCLSVGPFSYSHKDTEEILHIMEENHLSSSFLHELSTFYASVPVIEAPLSVSTTVLQLASGLFNQQYHLKYLPKHILPFSKVSQEYVQTRDNPQVASSSIQKRYDAENEVIKAISTGDYTKARIAYHKFFSYQISPRAQNPTRNRQHLAIIQNSLFRKAVEAGGVPPLYIDELSTQFALLINEISTLSDLMALSHEMLHKYCLLVQNHSMKGYSPIVKEIISYIDFHYAEDLGLNFFASKFNITKPYLSGIFKKETNATLTEFIHQVRMRQAMILLHSTSSSISSIASACGYNDINYFIRIFKKNYGVSPKQYQKSISPSTP